MKFKVGDIVRSAIHPMPVFNKMRVTQSTYINFIEYYEVYSDVTKGLYGFYGHELELFPQKIILK